MKMKNPMLVVMDIDKSVEFYKKVFGFHVIMDFGANKTFIKSAFHLKKRTM